MAAWIKELLLDYGLNRLSPDQKTDILTAIDGLIKSRALSPIDVWMIHAYIAGYTAEEIASLLYNIQWSITSEQVEKELYRMMVAIATASGYTDDILIQRAKRNKLPTKLAAFTKFLDNTGKDYQRHSI